nr:DMT family protein [Bacteroidales bacterium]
EFLSLTIFTVFMLIFFKDQPFTLNHLVGFVFLILAVYFIFKK